MKSFLFKNRYLLVLFIIIAAQMLAYNYINVFQAHPKSIHSWRQTDCLSFVSNFYTGRADFFEPCVNNLGKTGTGKVASEFPVVQYLIAMIWKLTGPSEILFRLIELFFLLLGLTFIYKIFLLKTRNDFSLSMIFTALIFTSPILAYYGPSFISDIQAFGLSCGGLFFFLRWREDKKTISLSLSISFFILAGLLKISSGFVFATCIGLLIINLLRDFILLKKFEKISPKVIAFFLLPFCMWVSWYFYAQQYNMENPNGFFLIGILPIWEIPFEKIKFLLMSFFQEMIPDMVNPYFLFCIGLAVLFYIKRPFNKEVSGIFISIMAFISFVVLFFDVFNVHDYYLINMVPILVIVVAQLLSLAWEKNNSFIKSPRFKITLIALLIFFTHTTALKCRSRFHPDTAWATKYLAMSKSDYDFYNYNSWYEDTHYKLLETPAFQLENFGIGISDTILCLGDGTINRSLYLMNRLGYTSFNVNMENIVPFIEEKKKKGLKFIVLIAPELKENKNLQPFLSNKLFEKDHTSVYKL